MSDQESNFFELMISIISESFILETCSIVDIPFILSLFALTLPIPGIRVRSSLSKAGGVGLSVDMASEPALKFKIQVYCNRKF